jgi:hypothetical protein
LKEIFEKVLNYFEGDYYKTLLWFYSENILLGGVSPTWMVTTNRIKKLKSFVDSQLEGNHP